MPNATGASVTFGLPGAEANVDLGSASRTVSAMTFAADVGTTIASVSGNSLILDDGSSPATIKAAGSHWISAAVTLNSDAAVNVTESSGTLSLTGIVSGNGGIIKTGLGVLSLTQADGYNGATTLNAGTLLLSGPNGA